MSVAPPATYPLAPGPRGAPLLGSIAEFRRDRVGFFLGLAREYGDVVRFRLGPVRGHLVRHPEGIRHVLQDNAANYTKHTRGFTRMKALLGEGLLTSEGAFWLRQRRIAQPAFHRHKLAGFAATMAACAEATAVRWREFAARELAFDVAAEMMRLTLDIVGRTLLGRELVDEADAVGRAMTDTLHIFNARITRSVTLPEYVPTPSNLRFRRARATLDRIVFETIAARRRDPGSAADLVSMLIEARDEDSGASMTDAQLRDEVMTIFLAGHETTANALAWTFYLLSKHPEARRALRAELARVLDGRTPTLADLPQLPFTAMVINEAMRLYPPAWLIGRLASRDDQIGGYRVPAGSMVFVSPLVTHHAPALWDDPAGFDPERFAPERAARLPRYAYFPFGGGPRQCIGNNFALMEAQLALATLAQRFELDLVPGHPVEPEPFITLRPRLGVLVRARAR